MRRFKEMLSLVWQVPLTVLSFLFYRVARCGLRCLVRLVVKRKRAENEEVRWLTLSEVLENPLGLAYIMVTGPRWNCHAVLGQTGPLIVRSNIEVNVETANQSAREWTLVLYDEQAKTKTFVSSADLKSDKNSKEIRVEPGVYMLSVRYYHCSGEGRLPAIKTDGVECVPAREMGDEWKAYQAFLEKYRHYRGWFYYALHYYVFNLLRWKSWLPASWVRKEFLPVGNPDTRFFYGIIRKDERLAIRFEPGLLEQASVFLCLYNKSSFPVFWDEPGDTGYESPVMPCDGYYLIRVHRKMECDYDEILKRYRFEVDLNGSSFKPEVNLCRKPRNVPKLK